MTCKLLDIIGREKGAYRKIQKGETHLTGYYHILKRQFKAETKKAKRNYKSKVESESKNNPKAFYQMYKAKAKDSVGPIKDVSNKITDNDLEMCNIFNLQFLSVFTNENKQNSRSKSSF